MMLIDDIYPEEPFQPFKIEEEEEILGQSQIGLPLND